MPLTIPEKEHWLERLRRLLDRKVATLLATDATLHRRIETQARQRAWQSLGLAPVQAEWEAIAAQRKDLRRRLRQAHRAMLAIVRRVPLAEVPAPRTRGLPQAVAQALRQRQAAHAEELLAEDPLGREIVRLRREQEALPDTIWLARSAAQLRTLWQQVCVLVGQEPTPLQRAALEHGSPPPASA
jgi:hypothetical protein